MPDLLTDDQEREIIEHMLRPPTDENAGESLSLRIRNIQQDVNALQGSADMLAQVNGMLMVNFGPDGGVAHILKNQDDTVLNRLVTVLERAMADMETLAQARQKLAGMRDALRLALARLDRYEQRAENCDLYDVLREASHE